MTPRPNHQPMPVGVTLEPQTANKKDTSSTGDFLSSPLKPAVSGRCPRSEHGFPGPLSSSAVVCVVLPGRGLSAFLSLLPVCTAASRNRCVPESLRAVLCLCTSPVFFQPLRSLLLRDSSVNSRILHPPAQTSPSGLRWLLPCTLLPSSVSPLPTVRLRRTSLNAWI